MILDTAIAATQRCRKYIKYSENTAEDSAENS